MKRVYFALGVVDVALAAFNLYFFAGHHHLLSLGAAVFCGSCGIYQFHLASRHPSLRIFAGLDGPSRTIIVEPVEVPATDPPPLPEPVPERTPEREPEKVPA